MATLRGLEKNMFWALRLSVPTVFMFSLGSAFALAPLLGAALATPIGLASCAVWLVGAALPWWAWGHPLHRAALGLLLQPVSVLILLLAAWNSTAATLRRRGIEWRGDLIPLSELRAALKPASWWLGRPLRLPIAQGADTQPTDVG